MARSIADSFEMDKKPFCLTSQDLFLSCFGVISLHALVLFIASYIIKIIMLLALYFTELHVVFEYPQKLVENILLFGGWNAVSGKFESH